MGILVAAAITTALAAGAYGWLIRRMAKPDDRRLMLVAVMIALPLQPLAFYAVRAPLHGLLAATLGAGPILTVLTLLYAPLTEEPAKWATLLVPGLRRRLRPDNAVPLALAVGLGFGIGEIWFLALRLAAVPAIAGVPFYMFGGFLGERFLVCGLHGAFVAFAFHALAHGRSFWPGAMFGAALHFFANLPVYFSAIGLFGLSREAWAWSIQLYLVGLTIALLLAVNRMAGDRLRATILGFAVCPGCGARYQRSWFGLNFGSVRYERCPSCRQFHWVPMRQPAASEGDNRPGA